MVRPHINSQPSQTMQRRDSRIMNEIFQTCHANVTKKIERSAVIDLTSTAHTKIPRFDRHEIVEGRVVGRGGFAVIREIASIRLDPGSDTGRRPSGSSSRSERTATTDKSSAQRGERDLLAKETGAKKGRKYVLKELNRIEASTENQNAYMNGIVDLAMEAQYLTFLSHPHILTLKGISTSNQFGGDDGMFLVLEYLPETMPRRLNTWMQRHRAYRGVTGLLTGSRGKAHGLLLERLRVAADIADVMSYLHGKMIIYRDLKPDNLGFNAENQVKLFDFGLAKELHERDRDSNGLYRCMTGFTGAIRYMAPEVGANARYNLAADVYSFSMLLWHIMALEPPLGLYTPRMMIDRVFNKGHRPVVDEKWPFAVQDLLHRGWCQDINIRPTMEQVTLTLRHTIKELEETL